MSSTLDSPGAQLAEHTRVHSWPPRDISLPVALAVFLRYRRVIGAAALVLGTIGVAAARLPAAKYRSIASFTPSAVVQTNGGALRGLASQLGFSLPSARPAPSPEFYQELLTSRDILRAVVERRYTASTDADETIRGDVVTLQGIVDGTPAQQVDEAMRWLREDAMTTAVERQTGVVSVAVVSRWPEVSRDILSALLEELDRFQRTAEQSQARAEVAFLEERLTAVAADLAATEAKLEVFLEENRQFAASPSLTLRHDRLQREASMRQQIHSGLVEAYEQARLHEMRDTPMLTILDRPSLPADREPRGTIGKTLLGILIGAMLAMVYALLRHSLVANKSHPDVLQLHAAWDDATARIRRHVRR